MQWGSLTVEHEVVEAVVVVDHRVRLLSGLVRLEPGHDLGEVPTSSVRARRCLIQPPT